MPIEIWQVYYLYTKAEDGLKKHDQRNKFHIVLCADPVITVLVSTDTPERLKNRFPVCYPDISARTNPFLVYDSTVDLTGTFRIQPVERFYGHLMKGYCCPDTQAKLTRHITGCPGLRDKDKFLVYEALGIPFVRE